MNTPIAILQRNATNARVNARDNRIKADNARANALDNLTIETANAFIECEINAIATDDLANAYFVLEKAYVKACDERDTQRMRELEKVF
jgi:hypothetical protein